MARGTLSNEQQEDQVIVQTIRDRIRSQAHDLLQRVDSLERRNHNNNNSNNISTSLIPGSSASSLASSSAFSSRSNSSNSLQPYEHDPEEKKVYEDCILLKENETESSECTSMSSKTTTTATTTSTSSSKTKSLELTKRLQKLALERNHQNDAVHKHQRLRMIQADASKSHYLSSSATSFQELDLPPHLLKAVFEMGMNRPSAIQEAALPSIIKGRNVIGQAQSGSGKTAAFALGMLYHTKIETSTTTTTPNTLSSLQQQANQTKSSSSSSSSSRHAAAVQCQGLVVAPTRELAIQVVEQAITPMSAYMIGLKVRLAIAGEHLEKDASLDTHIVVGTPGKVVDWIKRKIINPKTIKVFVLDEADSIVDVDGFRANLRLIKKSLSPTCQHLFFSATFPPSVIDFASKMVDRADKILIANDETLVLDEIKQLWIDTRQYEGGKIMFLADIYNLMMVGQSIIFVETRAEADLVHATLSNGGYMCSVLHSGLDAANRDATMHSFRRGESTVLITTNVLARGVDVDNVCLVVCCNVPLDREGQPDFETYLHRIGRTGRFGRKGTAITLVSDAASIQALAKIEEHFGNDASEMIHQAEADPEVLAEVIEI